MTANIDGLPPTMAARLGALVDAGLAGGVVTWPPATIVHPVHLVFTWESFDAGGDETERTGPIGPLEGLENLEVCKGEGLSEDGARSVFPVLAAPGVVTVSMPGGWSFRLTSEEEK